MEEPKILDWEIVEHKETFDYVHDTVEGKKVIEGQVEFAGVVGMFRYEKHWEYGNSGDSVKVDMDLPENLVEYIEDYISDRANELFE